MTSHRTWLLFVRHPLTSVLLAVALVSVAAVGMVRVLEGTLAPAGTNAGESMNNASATPSAEMTTLDRRQGERVHRALHDLGRACTARLDRPRQEVLRALRVIKRFVADHPNARFPIDDETGSTLSLLFVVRDELLTCAPSLVDGIDSLIPAQHRP